VGIADRFVPDVWTVVASSDGRASTMPGFAGPIAGRRPKLSTRPVILETAITISIRTVLNYLLERDLNEFR
jgi:hypothetical protein